MNVRTRSWTIAMLMIATFGVTLAVTPQREVPLGSVVLDTMISHEFGGWRQESADVVQVATELERTTGKEIDRPVYDQVLMRSYRRASDGAVVMFALAYARAQRQELKIHRPELCYYGQGFEVTDTGQRVLPLASSVTVRSQTLLTRNLSRIEPVTYWIRVGHRVSESAWQTRWEIFREGLGGAIPDGILVRTSSLVRSATQLESALRVQREFLSDLYASLPPSARQVLAGS
jgi:EpsI family protein